MRDPGSLLKEPGDDTLPYRKQDTSRSAFEYTLPLIQYTTLLRSRRKGIYLVYEY